MRKSEVKNLEKRLEHISGAGKVWIPSWLSAVGSVEEIAEWKAISHAYHGPDLYERRLEFARRMREKHPDMPRTFEEELKARRKELENNPALRKTEGLE